MRQKSVHPESSSERIVKNIRRATRKRHSSEEKIRIVLDGLRGESSIAELCRREGIAEGLYYAWSKEFLEAGKRRLAGDTARAATSGEVKDLRREAQELKAVVAEQALELRLLKNFNDSLTTFEDALRFCVEIRTKLREGGEFTVLSQVAFDTTSNLFHRLDLCGRSDAAHG